MARPFPRPTLLLASCLLAGCSTLPGKGDVVAIGAVQGAAAQSPRVDQAVTVEGVVSRVLDTGWFVQDAGDGDDATSDALFVADADNASGVRAGERVRVRGTVAEQAGKAGSRTALTQPQVRRLGEGALPLLALTQTPADWERLEGMRVRIATLTLADTGRLHDGRALASFDGRLWQPGERADPGSDAAAAISADNARRALWLDADGEVTRWPAGIERARTGSLIEGATGVVDADDKAGYRLLLESPPALQAASRPQPPQVPGDVRIAALNLENLFNGDGQGGGFPTLRGARNADELSRQLAKHVATLRALDADVVALMELENDGYGPHSSLAALVDALNADGADWRAVGACPEPCRRVDARKGPGDNAIRVGLIYRATRVRPQGQPATLESGPFGPHSRVPLAQAFVPLRAGRVDGAAFVVVANHLKSKGCTDAQGLDRDQRDGASCWNATRTDSVRRLDAWLKTDPTRSRSGLTLVVGDMNAYAREEPLRTFAAAGWRDAFAVTGAQSPYSYVYDGRIGRLDHALLSPALAQRLRGASEWHSNADEPESSGYRDGGDGPWRSSDHDPMLLGFDLRGR